MFLLHLIFLYGSNNLTRGFRFIILNKSSASAALYIMSRRPSHIFIFIDGKRFISFISQTVKIFPSE